MYMNEAGDEAAQQLVPAQHHPGTTPTKHIDDILAELRRRNGVTDEEAALIAAIDSAGRGRAHEAYRAAGLHSGTDSCFDRKSWLF